MKLQQLRYLKAVIDNNLNISVAANSLFTTQPGVSKQIRLLESELGVKIFERKGKSISTVTPIGKQIIDEAIEMLEKESRIKTIVRDHIKPEEGFLNIYTTNTIARYLIPEAVERFVKRYPKIKFHIGTSQLDKYGHILKRGQSDFSILAQNVEREKDIIVLPAYKWNLSLIVPKDHPLANDRDISIEKIGAYPLISYEPGSTGRSAQDKAFKEKGISPYYFMTVMDVEVIKKYVNLGYGIGIIAQVAAQDVVDENLVSIPLNDIIPACDAWLCYSRNLFLQKYMLDFIELFCPHLTREVMEDIAHCSDNEILKISEQFELPEY
ncbi:LysR substrate-binding domain-containing protein [Photobacterium rosenbergii]|uniref:LysR substrate-binding domain-containing protein n=1 Tax=Photobacterium rosenbergii TaxID=294936 RepID=A0ABU3ZDX2_9GAMM|nr:LysR substrate-binding domain-containing protein [Photobacterium rosenbergii]MDV5168203.1 LysR substrate-binding domain-containing protein [Photobacterium rosenbergii]